MYFCYSYGVLCNMKITQVNINVVLCVSSLPLSSLPSFCPPYVQDNTLTYGLEICRKISTPEHTLLKIAMFHNRTYTMWYRNPQDLRI